MQNSNETLPLTGVRVLDLSRILAGPTCAMVLGDLGAEVIKIEHPERGDDTRDWGEPIGSTQTSYFNGVNRNKTSVTLNLQSEKGQQIARELARNVDVVIHNFKFGGVEKFGLDYDTLSKENPRLIYCAISGYDRTGPEAARPGYDLVVQGESGLMALNGESTQPPLKFGIAAVDIFTGMTAAQGVLAAVIERYRTGKGKRVELALFDCGVALTSYYGLAALIKGEDPLRFGNGHPSVVPYGVFDAADGPLVITVGNNSQFARFCKDVIDRPDLADDERFTTNINRSVNRDVLLAELRQEISKRERTHLLERLRKANIPCGEVMGLKDALMSPRVRDSGLVVERLHPEVGSTPVLAPSFRFDGERLPIRFSPPALGEGTDTVLKELLAMTDEQLCDLRETGVI